MRISVAFIDFQNIIKGKKIIKPDAIFAYYYELRIIRPANLLIPSPKSASDWSPFELEYYNIQFIDADENTMFGSDSVDFSKEIKNFLSFHTDDFLKVKFA